MKNALNSNEPPPRSGNLLATDDIVIEKIDIPAPPTSQSWKNPESTFSQTRVSSEPHISKRVSDRLTVFEDKKKRAREELKSVEKEEKAAERKINEDRELKVTYS